MGLTPRAGAYRRSLAWVISAAVIAWFTLRPAGGGPTSMRPGGYLLTDVILNVILFVPFGIGLGLAGQRPLIATLTGALASTAIELAQLWWIPGRDASVHDVITNTIGTLTGALIVAGWDQRTRLWSRLAPGIAAVTVACWVGGPFLLRSSVPPRREWYAQWAHDFAGVDTFAGRVLGLTLQGIPLPDGRIQEGDRLRSDWAGADTVRLRTVVVTGPPAPANAQVVAVLAPGGEEGVSIWQDGDALIGRHRLALSEAGLRTPWIRLEGALPAEAGDTVQVDLLVTRRTVRLAAAHAGQSVSTAMRLSPDLFWSAFLPFDWQGGTGSRRWPLFPALLTYVVLGMALGKRPLILALAAGLTLTAGPLLGAGAFPDLAAMVVALLGSAVGWLTGRRLSLWKQKWPPLEEAAIH